VESKTTLNPVDLNFKNIVWREVSESPRSFSRVIKAARNKTALDFLSNLPIGRTLNEKIIIYCLNLSGAPNCKNCGNPVSLKDNCISKGWETFCGKSCKTSNTNGARYLIPGYLEKFKDAYRKTWKSNPNNELVVKRQDETRRKNCLEKYGVELTWQLPEIQRKCHENCNKSMHSYKIKRSKVTGKTYRCRGYEIFAIEILENQNVEFIANDFETPTIRYDFLGKTRNYFPDIYLPKENKIIEIKSDYWLFKQFDKNLAIQRAVLNSGKKFEFWVFDSKQNLRIINII